MKSIQTRQINEERISNNPKRREDLKATFIINIRQHKLRNLVERSFEVRQIHLSLVFIKVSFEKSSHQRKTVVKETFRVSFLADDLNVTQQMEKNEKRCEKLLSLFRVTFVCVARAVIICRWVLVGADLVILPSHKSSSGASPSAHSDSALFAFAGEENFSFHF